MQPINQMTTVRLPDGNNVAFVDWSDRPLYSTADVLNGATDEKIPLFNYVQGQAVSGTSNLAVKRNATDRDTNIASPAAMASTEEMLVYAIRPEYVALVCATPNDATSATETQPFDPIPDAWQLAHMHRVLILQLTVSQKVMQQAPLGYFNTGYGAINSLATGAAATVAYDKGGAGLPSQEAVRALSIPIHIGGQEKYEVALVNPSGLTLNVGLSSNAFGGATVAQRLYQVRVNLDGLYKRPVA